MKKLFYIVVLSSLAYSCTPPLYIPNTTNIPTLKEKGDIDIAYSLGTNGHDLQSNYAITNEFGIMVNGSYGNSKSDSSNNFSTHQFIELAAGYSLIGNKEKDEKTIFNVFGGYGMGKASGEYSFTGLGLNTYTNSVSGNYSRIFIQPSIGVSSSELDFSFAIRTSFVNFSDIKNDLDQSIINDEYINEIGEVLTPKKSNVYYEPTLTLRYGGDHLKFMMQAGFSDGLNPRYKTAFRQRPVILIIGIHSDLNVFKK